MIEDDPLKRLLIVSGVLNPSLVHLMEQYNPDTRHWAFVLA